MEFAFMAEVLLLSMLLDNRLFMEPARIKQLTAFLENASAAYFPEHDTTYMVEILNAVQALFAGRYPGYQRCDTEYHDFGHTLQATEAVVRILGGHICSGAKPDCSGRDLDLGVTASLLHDSGYLKRVGDNTGTGAKYTVTHVERSADFAAAFLPAFGVTLDEINLVQVAIRCTGINVERTMWSFLNEREWLLGCAMGAGDILGQMAAPDYPERLPALYREYREAVEYSHLTQGMLVGFTSVEDLMGKTRGFYQDYVQRMLGTVWGSVHESLIYHFDGANLNYFSRIEENLKRIDQILQARQNLVSPQSVDPVSTTAGSTLVHRN